MLAPGSDLGYDAMYQVVWARDALAGHVPEFELRLAPTPHPLQIAAAMPAALLGQGADDVLRLVSLLSLGLLGAGAAAAGAALFSVPVGALACAVVLTRPHLIEMAHAGDAAVPAAALVAWAGVSALRRQDAGAMALLAAAGLLRPEAWLLAGALLAWAMRRRRARASGALIALAAAGPLLWIAADLAVTGDPLWSLHHTREGTVLLERPTGVPSALEQLPRHLDFLLGAPSLAAGALGFVAGLLALRRRMTGLAAAMAVAGAGFLALAVARLSLQPRYLAALATAIALCAALAALGWTALDPAHPRRRAWRALGWAVLALLAAGLPGDARELAAVRSALRGDAGRLEALARGPARPALTRCPPAAVPTIRPIPFLAFWSGARPSRFLEAGGAAGTGATLVTPTPAGESYIGGGGDRHPERVVVQPAPGQRRVAGDASWQVFSRCPPPT